MFKIYLFFSFSKFSTNLLLFYIHIIISHPRRYTEHTNICEKVNNYRLCNKNAHLFITNLHVIYLNT